MPCSYILSRVTSSIGCLRTVSAGSPRVISLVQMWMEPCTGIRSGRNEPSTTEVFAVSTSVYPTSVSAISGSARRCTAPAEREHPSSRLGPRLVDVRDPVVAVAR